MISSIIFFIFSRASILLADVNEAIVFSFTSYTLISFGCMYLELNLVSIQNALVFMTNVDAFLFHLFQLIDSGDWIELTRSLVVSGVLIPGLYFFCHLGEELTERFQHLGYEFYSLAWYSLPVHMQKEFPTMISMSQQRLYLRGYINTRCTRALFKRVRHFTFNSKQFQ